MVEQRRCAELPESSNFLSGHAPDEEVLLAMTRRLSHRGPNGLGTWLSPDGVGLGNARLAVIDLPGGGQPMVRTTAGRSWSLTYNGEIYNAGELRQRLTSLGHRIQTRSDTEVVLAAYVEWDRACLDRFDGIFAFALYDSGRKTLFLARDRLGVKPLFFTARNGRFLFASEIKALLAHPAISPTVDADGLAELVLNFPVRTPGKAIFRGLEELRPGFLLEVDPRGVRSQPYWRPPARPHEDGEAKTIRRTRELLQDAVARQVTADVPVCTLLSGGVDSSTVTALASAAMRGSSGSRVLSTFTVEYADSERDFVADDLHSSRDLPFVDDVVDFLGSHHRTILVTTAEIVGALEDSLAARDLPSVGDMDAALYLLCRRVKEQATVALSGEGSDELFGGYWGWALKDGRSPPAPGRFPWMLIGDRNTWLLRPEIEDLIRPRDYVRRVYDEAVAEVAPIPGLDAEEAEVRPIFHILRTRFLHMLLERQDRMSMAAGLEVRVPFSITGWSSMPGTPRGGCGRWTVSRKGCSDVPWPISYQPASATGRRTHSRPATTRCWPTPCGSC